MMVKLSASNADSLKVLRFHRSTPKTPRPSTSAAQQIFSGRATTTARDGTSAERRGIVIILSYSGQFFLFYS